MQDAQPRTLVRSDRSDYDQVRTTFKNDMNVLTLLSVIGKRLKCKACDQVLIKLGKSGRHYDQTVPLQVGKVLMAAWMCLSRKQYTHIDCKYRIWSTEVVSPFKGLFGWLKIWGGSAHLTWKETEVAEDLVDGEPAVRLVVLLLHQHLPLHPQLHCHLAQGCHLGDWLLGAHIGLLSHWNSMNLALA